MGWVVIVKYSENFLKEAKKLAKKYKPLKTHLQNALKEIESSTELGTALGYNLFKKKVPNSSIPTGKSGGFRLIIYQRVEDKIVLVSIYSKTKKDSLSDEELRALLKEYFK